MALWGHGLLICAVADPRLHVRPDGAILSVRRWPGRDAMLNVGGFDSNTAELDDSNTIRWKNVALVDTGRELFGFRYDEGDHLAPIILSLNSPESRGRTFGESEPSIQINQRVRTAMSTASMTTLDQLPRVAGEATTIDEFIELGRTNHLAISDRGVEVVGYSAGQAVLNGKDFDKSAMFKKRLDDLGIVDGQIRDDWEVLLPTTEGDLRQKIRVMYAGMMRPAQIAKFNETVTGLVAGVFDELGDATSADLMTEVAWKVPSRMYCELVGAPYSFAPSAARLSDSVLGPVFTADTSRRQESIDALYETYDIISEHIAHRRENLGTDFTSAMIRHELEGNLTQRQMLLNAVGLLHASIDNTVHQIGIIFGTLLQRRGVWDRLVEDPNLIPAAVEEAMRLTPRFNTVMRKTITEVEVEGVAIPEGTMLYVQIPAAQRDVDMLDDPDEFRLDRKPYRPLEFGGGNYNCLGQHLARLEMAHAVRQLVARYPNAHLADGFEFVEFPTMNEVHRLDVDLV